MKLQPTLSIFIFTSAVLLWTLLQFQTAKPASSEPQFLWLLKGKRGRDLDAEAEGPNVEDNVAGISAEVKTILRDELANYRKAMEEVGLHWLSSRLKERLRNELEASRAATTNYDENHK